MTILKKEAVSENKVSIDLNSRQMKAIDYQKQYGRITNKEYQKINDISREMATIDLRKLVESDIIKSSGSKGAGAFYILK